MIGRALVALCLLAGAGTRSAASPALPLEIDRCPAPPAGLTPDQIRAAASEHFDRGQVLYDQGDYTRAVADLAWAYCMSPRYYTILKSIGQAYERALDYERAIAYFELYVERVPPDAQRASPCDPDPQADRHAMSARIKVLHELPARVQIDTPVAATIDIAAVDEVPGRRAVSGAPFELPGGHTYTATIRAPGYVERTRTIEAHIGRPSTEYVPLARETGRVRLRVSPPDAKIALDDRYLGTGGADVAMEARHYTLRIDAPDHVALETGLDVLPGRDTQRSYELQPIPQVGHRQLLAYAGLAGVVAGAAEAGLTGNRTLTIAGAIAGAGGGVILAYYGSERDVPLGTSSLAITSSLIGGVVGFDLGLVGGGSTGVLDNGTDSRLTRAIGGGGLVIGGLAGYAIGERTHISPGDAAVVNSGALWGGVAGHLLGLTFLPANSTIGGLGLAGLAVGTTGGVLLARYYKASRKHAALIDAAGVAGMITGIAGSNLIFNQASDGGQSSAVRQERTADFALGGLAVGLIVGGVLTRTVDLPKLPGQMQLGTATTGAGKTTTTFGIGGAF